MTITKINAGSAHTGDMGEKYLAKGEHLGMRYWSEPPGEVKPLSTRPYETVGFVLEGHAEFEMNGEKTELRPGDSWVIPAHARHTYRIKDHFVAIEATTPPARGDKDQ